MLNVAQFHSSLGLYGPERWTHLLTRYADARVETRVVTIGCKPGNDAFSRFLASEGVPCDHLAIPGRLNPRAVVALRRLLVDQHVDVLHTHGFKTDVLGYLATRGLSVALVTTAHGWCDHQGARVHAYEAIGRAFLPGFDAVYAVSDHQAAFLRRRRVASRVRVIRNAVDIAAFDAVLERRRRRQPTGVGRLLFVGRVVREKGIQDLIRAVRLLGERGRAVHLDVVGEGTERAAAEETAAALGDAITFHGQRNDVRPFLEDADALVLPSYGEGLPRVLMEAGAAGLPVIGSRVPGIMEIVRDRETGFLVAPGDPTALAGTIEHALAHPRETEAFAARARTMVEARHSPRRMVEELAAEYERLVAR
jgi:glycosyltransferase involved in cell wall biosynthesis